MHVIDDQEGKQSQKKRGGCEKKTGPEIGESWNRYKKKTKHKEKGKINRKS